MSNMGPNPGEYFSSFGPYATSQVVMITFKPSLKPGNAPSYEFSVRDPAAITLGELNDAKKMAIKILPRHVLAVTITIVLGPKVVVSTTQIPASHPLPKSTQQSSQDLTASPDLVAEKECCTPDPVGVCPPGCRMCPDDGREFELQCDTSGEEPSLNCVPKTFDGPPKPVTDKSAPQGGCCGP